MSSDSGQAPVDDTDLMVLGSGVAGLTGALTAARRGVRVLLVEKTDLIGGTSAVSGGTMWVPNNRLMPEAGVPDSREEALEYTRACVGDAGDDSHVVALVDHGRSAVDELMEAGLAFAPFPTVGGGIDYRPWLPGSKHGGRGLTSQKFDASRLGEWADQVRHVSTSEWDFDPRDYFALRMHLDAPGDVREKEGDGSFSYLGRGAALVAQLLHACLESGVRIVTGTRALSLAVTDGRVTGAVVENAERGTFEVTAAVGVLIATGGYSHSDELKRLWLARPLEVSCELETNVGDGQLMGMAAGVQTAGLGDAWWMPQIPNGVDNGVVNSAGSREDRILPHTMMVNARGRRFMNEAVNYHDAGESFGTTVEGATPRNYPAWLLFDQAGVDRYAILHWKVVGGEGNDWFRRADSIAELASQIEVDPEALVASVDRFNGFAESGKDLDFGRGDNDWDRSWGDPGCTPNPCMAPLSRGPYYAVRVLPGSLSTRGGIRVDDRGRAYSAATGDVMPGLYAAGNASNAGPTGAYPGPGATLGAAVTFGWLAGVQVAEDLAAKRTLA